MSVTFHDLRDLGRGGFDAVIDVRSPGEFARDHLPGALNLPVLSDDERARVGTLHQQVSSFDARRVGAALVARNAARHIEGPLADKKGGWRPLIYCWRGGQRSRAFALILREVGWPAEVLAGGYKAWRRLVTHRLQDMPVPSPVIVLDGNTGTAKTALLHLLAARGVQVIDLEGLARHRGSLFGALGAQPAQKAFEGALAMALVTLDPARPVVVEAESARIGTIGLPARLWQAMKTAPRIVLDVPVPVRARYLARAYADIIAAPGRLDETIDALRRYHPAARIRAWHAMAADGRFTALAEELVIHHYDPGYRRHRDRAIGARRRLVVDDLAPAALDHVADRLAGMIRSRDEETQ